MSATTSTPDLLNWLALQKAKNAADGTSGNLLTPAPAANRPAWWDNPAGAERLNDTYASPASANFSPLIGAYGARPVTAAMRANALDIASAASQFGPADMASIRAFHGSPYDFHAFDTSKIGTGEGAQAYGHGHYAAGAESTAQTYKKPGSTLEWNGQPVEPGKPAYDLVDNLSNQDWRLGKIVEQATKYGPANAVETFEPHTRNTSDGAAWQAAMDKFKEGAGKSATGHMYELDIHADPEHFLDWDKPLSGQSQHVQDKLLNELGVKRSPASAATGEMVYKSLGYGQKPEQTAQALRDAGIPGIRYLDQGSRAGRVQDLSAMTFSPTPGPWGVEGVMDPKTSSGWREFPSREEAQAHADTLKTSNYVVFDPKTIEILRKYGIAGLVAGGAAAAGTSSQDQQ